MINPERWQQTELLYHAALERESDARAAFLDEACADDPSLRQEVESLLAYEERTAHFITTPPDEVAAEMLAAAQAPSPLGKSLGHYQILSLLGKGGMGEVYQARDNRLDRTVALKILPALVAADKERMQRFVREAKAASALNHPHVATIYEIGAADGVSFIAMEYVEGQSLAAKINGHPLTVKEIVEFGSQIADALDEAHRKGITHRDIKPANIMLTAREQVKVLDFGLAKITRPPSIDSNVSTLAKTQSGVLMGTVPYMSPEQALGREVDHRSDIFSLGVVLYEMATGRLPFAGTSMSETLDLILHAQPEAMARFNYDVPAELERIVRKCLEKERERRYQSARELLVDLKNLQRDSSEKVATAAARSVEAVGTRFASWRGPVGAAMIAVLLLGLAAFLYWRRTPAMQPEQTRQTPQEQTRSTPARSDNPAAYEDYLRGRFHSNRQNKADNETAIKFLERAVAADPNFAAAHAELAQAYVWRFFLFTPDEKQWEEKAFVAVEKAFSLDRNLAVAHLARGRLLWTPARGFPHEQAIQEYRRALALDSSLDEARNQLALVYNHIGAFDLALRELQQALTDNPTNSSTQFRIGETLLFQGKYAQALTVLRQIPKETDLAKLGAHLARALIHVGQRAEAAAFVAQLLRDYPGDTDVGLFSGIQALLAALDGDAQQAEAKIKTAIAKGKGFGHFHHTAYDIACAYALLKQPEPALQWLQAVADEGFPCYALFETEPYLDSLKTDPRFVALTTKLKEQWGRYRTGS